MDAEFGGGCSAVFSDAEARALGGVEDVDAGAGGVDLRLDAEAGAVDGVEHVLNISGGGPGDGFAELPVGDGEAGVVDSRAVSQGGEWRKKRDARIEGGADVGYAGAFADGGRCDAEILGGGAGDGDVVCDSACKCDALAGDGGGDSADGGLVDEVDDIADAGGSGEIDGFGDDAVADLDGSGLDAVAGSAAEIG